MPARPCRSCGNLDPVPALKEYGRPVGRNQEPVREVSLAQPVRKIQFTIDDAPGPAGNPTSSRMKKFLSITARSGSWRLADRKDGGFDLQHRDHKRWQTVKEFPWAGCDR